jgi:hypothetical protein
MALPVLQTNKQTERETEKKDALSNHKSNLKKHSLLENYSNEDYKLSLCIV